MSRCPELLSVDSVELKHGFQLWKLLADGACLVFVCVVCFLATVCKRCRLHTGPGAAPVLAPAPALVLVLVLVLLPQRAETCQRCPT